MSTPTQANQAPIGDPGKLRHVEAGSVQEFLTTPEAKRWADALEVLSEGTHRRTPDLVDPSKTVRVFDPKTDPKVCTVCMGPVSKTESPVPSGNGTQVNCAIHGLTNGVPAPGHGFYGSERA